MSPFSLLLRLLLCVTLIANGVGFAQASTRMQVAHTAHGAQQPASQPGVADAARECHPGMTMAAHAGAPPSAVDHAAMGHGSDGEVADDGQPTDAMDCCDGENCQCACTQHASAASIADVSSSALPVRSVVAMGGTSRHAPPRLPHLIRPPIG